YKDIIESTLKNDLSLIIIKKYKKEYLLSHLNNLDLLNEYKEIFLKVLMNFDIENDILEIEKNLRFNGKIYLNEFYYFKLKSLQKKWQEICDLTNENFHFFESDALFFELLKFLISNFKYKTEKVMIKKENGKLLFLVDGEEINSLEDKNKTSEVIDILLDTMPKFVVIQNVAVLSKDTISVIKKIFREKITFMMP
ncbi:MAG: hypothetical protein KBT30_00125, partial [Clostridiales bacterium]|nr:hypothetical protein [Candidatus Apopatousia equi]